MRTAEFLASYQAVPPPPLTLANSQKTWSSSLANVTKRLNARFAAGMAQMGNRGTVELRTGAGGDGGSDDDIASTRIAVRVAFRVGEELQPLSSGKQSGGERAVSTMLFLLAMQADTPLPFRILDEINQGMDVKNERLIMENLVRSIAEAGSQAEAAVAADSAAARRRRDDEEDEGGGEDEDEEAYGGGGSVARRSMPAGAGAASSSSSSSSSFTRGRQLFIISPKLIPDLRHHSSMRTAVVFNGPAAGASLEDSRAVGDHFTHVDFAAIARDLRYDPASKVLAGLRDSSSKQQPPLKLQPQASKPAGGGAAATTVPRKRPRTTVDDDDDDEDNNGGGAAADDGFQEGAAAAAATAQRMGGGKRARAARAAAARDKDDDDGFDDE